jgi:hypothetical protein
MSDTKPGLQLCPTRIDRAPVLFAHKVSPAQCQDRQRGQYHKCFTCAFNNAYVALNGKPVPSAPAASKQSQIQVG